MKNINIINLNSITLKPLDIKDIENVRSLRNTDSVRRNFIYDKIIDRENQEKWFQEYLEKDNDLMWSIFFKNKWCGAVAVYDVDLERKQAEFGRIMLDNCIRGKGFSRNIIAGVIEYCSKILRLSQLMLSVKINNEVAIKTYQSVGFVIVKEVDEYYYMNMKL